MNSANFQIESIFNKNILIRPLAFWLFLNFLGACFNSPVDDKDYYHFKGFFTFLLYSTSYTLINITFILLRQQKIRICNKRLSYTNVFGKVKADYLLNDIVDFKWSNKPNVVKKNWTGGQESMKNETIEVFFNDQRSVLISFEQYRNFDEIKVFLFNYCFRHQIIQLKPLEERKKSSLQKSFEMNFKAQIQSTG